MGTLLGWAKHLQPSTGTSEELSCERQSGQMAPTGCLRRRRRHCARPASRPTALLKNHHELHTLQESRYQATNQVVALLLNHE